MFRGTLRNKGWCSTLKKIADLGLLEEEEKDWTGLTYKDFLKKLMNDPVEEDIKKALSAHLNIEESSDIIQRFEWLGLLSDEPLPLEKGSPLNILGAKMLEKLQYEEGERDMIMLQHQFIASYPGDKKEKITSTLIDFGIPHGDTSMGRTVGLPAAISTKLILEGKIEKTGVHIPVTPEIYIPILQELKELDIAFKEKKEEM
jgi:saccharopine dehydrogenase (NADP+, L-glutamate forming)/spermidine synthase